VSGSSTNSPLRIGFDLDGVVYNFRKALSDYLVASGRFECTLDNALPHWDFFEGWGLTLEEYLALYRSGVDDGFVLRLGDPLPGSIEGMKRLYDAGHSIHIVTDRKVATDPNRPSLLTEAWLLEHGVPFDSLTLSSDKTAVATDYFIDDRYENYVARVRAGMACHLLTQPWNANLGDCSTERVDSVEQFVDEILGGTPPRDRGLREQVRVG
jgi:hypothetical protein